MRLRLLACFIALVTFPMSVFAQAPVTAPVVLSVPASARVAALGGAWVSGRDQDVIFYNPAQLIGTRSDLSVSLGRLGPTSGMGALTSNYTGGKLSLTLGWGVQMVNFKTPDGSYPDNLDVLPARGFVDAQSSLAVVGGAIVYKGFRMGASLKYASDRAVVNHHAWLTDLGMAHNLFGGVVAVAGQNLGGGAIHDVPAAKIPRQLAMGWSTTRPAGPLDLGVFTQLTVRSGFTSPAAGLEAGYSWIEGYLVTIRAGVRRAEAGSARPMTMGAGFSADRVTIDYALEFFDNSHRAHRVTIRWR